MMEERSKRIKSKVIAAIIKSFYYFGKAFSKAYTPKLNFFLDEVSGNFYSGWQFGRFKTCGDNLNISAPFYGIGLNYITIGENFVAGPGLRLEAFDHFLHDTFIPHIIIGDNVNINFDCHIGCIDRVQIGHNVLIASKVMIIDHAHGEITMAAFQNTPMRRPLVTKGPIIIEDNVWIGEGCVIMPGVKIGANCIVGSNTVVTKSFGPNSIVAGNPARVIKHIE